MASSRTDARDDTGNEATALYLKELTVGTVIDAKYRIDEIIGRGAMGLVAAATHVHLKERVALKFLSTRGQDSGEDFRSRFQREAQVSAKLRNEHITRVIDVGVWRDVVPFMVMDHLVGADLRQTMRAHGALPVGVALDYVVQICVGMAEAHAHGIVHRDLKPSNLFVTHRGDGSDLVKILDFGISKWSASDTNLDDLTRTGVVLGSPKYMAPEQLFGSSTVDARADVWSIAAIFYEMVSGRPPYDQPTLVGICAELGSGKPPPSLIQLKIDVPPALDDAVMRCFVRDPDERTQNVAELAGALLDAIEAPFASAVQQKIAAVLAGTKGGGTITGSGGFGGATGAYGTLSLSLTGSSGARRPSLAIGQSAPALGPETANKKRAGIVIGVVALAVVLAAIAGVLLTTRHEPASASASQPPASQPAAPMPTGSPAAAPMAGPATSPFAAGEAHRESAALSASASPSPSPPARAGAAPAITRAPVRAPARGPARAVEPPSVVTAAPAAAPAAPAAPLSPAPAAPAETAKKKLNPLEDRQ